MRNTGFKGNRSQGTACPIFIGPFVKTNSELFTLISITDKGILP